jgi:hypothetical protein
VSFRDYLRLEGACSIALGVALVAVAAAFGRWDGPVWLAPVVAVVGSALAVAGARAATRNAVRDAADGPPRMAEGAVRRQTVAETVLWVAAVLVWVAATGDSAELVAGTGVASIAFGAVRRAAEVPAEVRVSRRRWLLGAQAAAPRTAPAP